MSNNLSKAVAELLAPMLKKTLSVATNRDAARVGEPVFALMLVLSGEKDRAQQLQVVTVAARRAGHRRWKRRKR